MAEKIKTWDDLEKALGKKFTRAEQKEFTKNLAEKIVRSILDYLPCGHTPAEIDTLIDQALHEKKRKKRGGK